MLLQPLLPLSPPNPEVVKVNCNAVFADGMVIQLNDVLRDWALLVNKAMPLQSLPLVTLSLQVSHLLTHPS